MLSVYVATEVTEPFCKRASTRLIGRDIVPTASCVHVSDIGK